MKRPHFFLLYIVLSLLFMVGCNKDKGTILPPEVELEEVRIENMVYGNHPRQRMDVFLPKTRDENTPVLLMLHGGFWVEGDKSSFTPIQQQLLGMGYACINLNYRFVSPDNDYTGLMDDIGAALALVRDHSKEWGIADKGYHLAGFSAGGHMALLYAYSAKSPGELTSAISIAGPVGLTEDLIGDLASKSPEIQEALQWLAGAPLPKDEEDPNLVNYQLASPISHIQTAVPTLLMHGSSDEVVPFSQSQTLKTALDHLQMKNQLVVLQEAGHDVSLAPVHMIQILLQLTNWLKTF